MSIMSPMSKVYALSTARFHSRTPPGKNLIIIRGYPLYLHNLFESLATPEIKKTYITTDIPDIIKNGENFGYHPIRLEDEMYEGSVSHTEVIYRGLLEIEKDIGEELDILVVMLGNTINMNRIIVKKALQILESEPDVDSVVTVIQANHFNPLRAYVDNGSGYLTTFLDQDEIKERTSNLHLSDKNSQGNILFQNGLWIVRRKTIIEAREKNIGLQPFPWFGNKIRFIEQDPGLQEIDDLYQIRLLS